MNLSIADRRATAHMVARNPTFRRKLEMDPRSAIKEATGRVLSGNVVVDIADEKDAWCFVLPDTAEIEAKLPAPTDNRDAIENDIYALLRDQPGLRADATRDPKQFMRKHFSFEIGPTSVVLLEEAPGMLIIVVRDPAMQGEMPDELLDLVAGGGQSGCQTGEAKGTPDRTENSGG